MGLMEVVGTLSGLKVLMYRLSKNLECGKSIDIKVSDPQLLMQLPQVVISVNLSLISAREVKDGFVVTLENRFGDKCLG